ncbi:MAG: DUF2505 domain-containing protein [Propionibacteriaceae bacterium]|nr:DUF2505 domain-containing protein [Propionibacteriaceae bacterium]
MHLSYRHTYDASADAVIALMANPDFLSDVATQSGATSHDVRIEGPTTHMEMALEAPADVAKFVGKTIHVTQSLTWGNPDAQGTRRGTVDIAVAGLPIKMAAVAVLSPTGPDTSVGTYEGDLNVRIPLVGKKVESLVAPSINDAFDGIQRRAQEWLKR